MSQNSDSTDINTKFSSKAILKAFQALEPVLGRATIDSIIYDIGFHGMPLVNDQEFYSLSQLQATLENIFDSEVTLLLMDRLKKSLIKNI